MEEKGKRDISPLEVINERLERENIELGKKAKWFEEKFLEQRKQSTQQLSEYEQKVQELQEENQKIKEHQKKQADESNQKISAVQQNLGESEKEVDRLRQKEQRSKKKEKWNLIKILLLGVILLIVSIIGIYFYNKSEEYTVQCKLQTVEIRKLKKINEELEDQYNYLQSAYEFYNRLTVIVMNDDTGLYHCYGCETVQESDRYDFWIYNIEEAWYKGFEACPLCIEHWPQTEEEQEE